MKYLSILTLFFLLGILGLFAQVPDTAWTRTYGGSNNDYGESVQQTSDGGYIVAGYTNSFGAGGGGDIYLVKTDSLGDTLWTRTYGGDNFGFGYSVQQTTDEGYIITGIINTVANWDDVYLIKTDSMGDTIWTTTYGGISDDQGYSVQQTADGGYIVTGYTSSYGTGEDNVCLIKTNGSGDTLWTRTYGGDSTSHGNAVRQTSDGGYIVAGYTNSFGAGLNDVYLIKTDSLGDTLWTRTYGGIENDVGNSVQQTSDGGYIITGYTDSYGVWSNDVYLIKTDSLGDTLWTRTYGSIRGDYGESVQQTSDGGYIVVGGGTSDFYGDIYLIKTDSLGDTLWTRTYGGSEGADAGFSVQYTTDGGYIVVGYTCSSNIENADVYLIKIKPEGSGIEEEIITGLFSLSPADPNPFTTKTTIRYELVREIDLRISVFNMLGQKVRNLHSGKQSSGIHSVSWDGTGNTGEKLSSGIYFLKIEAEEKEASRKVMFVR